MGHSPFTLALNLANLHSWMQENNYIKLQDISLWSISGNWIRWKDLHAPPPLEENYSLFTSHLHGIALSNIKNQDIRGLGPHGFYTIK